MLERGVDYIDITGMEIHQVSNIMESYLVNYFTGFIVTYEANIIFQEVFCLAYDEIVNVIPAEQKNFYSKDGWFNGASGFIDLSSIYDGSNETYIVMLLMNEQQTQALYLYVTRFEAASNNDNPYILVKDFMQGDL